MMSASLHSGDTQIKDWRKPDNNQMIENWIHPVVQAFSDLSPLTFAGLLDIPFGSNDIGGLIRALNAAGPMEQFEIIRILPFEFAGHDVSFTNSSLWMLIAIAIGGVFMGAATRRPSLVPGRLQTAAEILYAFISEMLRGATHGAGMKFFPYVFSLFLFVFLSNFLGLLPSLPGLAPEFHTFTTTSHLIVTLALALFTFAMMIITGFVKQGTGFLKLFAPSGVPIWLLPLIIVIEVISFLSRPLSLGIRLFANMLAGHMILKIFAGFIVSLLAASPLLKGLAIFPLLGNVAVMLLELLVAFLQAYVFTMLTCIYLNDSVNEADH